MTRDEFRKTIVILSGADGGCSHCAGLLAEAMETVFPEHNWTAAMDFYDEHSKWPWAESSEHTQEPA